MKPLVDGATDVRTACKRAGIELRGDDGQPYCCSERMHVKGGLWGPDWARCRKCGKLLENVLSPHINGGRFVDLDTADEDTPFEDLPTWVVTAAT